MLNNRLTSAIISVFLLFRLQVSPKCSIKFWVLCGNIAEKQSACRLNLIQKDSISFDGRDLDFNEIWALPSFQIMWKYFESLFKYQVNIYIEEVFSVKCEFDTFQFHELFEKTGVIFGDIFSGQIYFPKYMELYVYPVIYPILKCAKVNLCTGPFPNFWQALHIKLYIKIWKLGAQKILHTLGTYAFFTFSLKKINGFI